MPNPVESQKSSSSAGEKKWCFLSSRDVRRNFVVSSRTVKKPTRLFGDFFTLFKLVKSGQKGVDNGLVSRHIKMRWLAIVEHL